MILFHPRKIIRRYRRLIHNWLFVRYCHRKGVRISIGDNSVLNHCHVKGSECCEIVIGENCSINYSSFYFKGKGGRIIVGEGTVINSYKRLRTSFFIRGETYIDIGKNCLFAHSIDISTTDYHSVLDSDGAVMNADASVAIGDHVWVGKRVTINKGVVVPNDSVIGASSVVTKAFATPNVLIAGNPAVVRKQGISWHK